MKKKKTLKKIPATAPPFVQIAAAENILYGLDANGRVWQLWPDGWVRLDGYVVPR